MRRITVQLASVRSRFAAWLVIGPLGHLAAGVLDWAQLLLRLLRRTG